MKNSLRAPFAFLCAAVLCAACAVPSQRRGRTDYSAAKGESPVVSAPQTPEEKQPDPPSQDPSAKNLPADKTVRVLLAEKQKNADIKHSGRVYVYTPNLSKKYKVSAPGTLAVKALGGGKIQLGTLQAAQTIILEPAQGTLLTWNKNV